MTESEQRAAVVAEAETWIDTPFVWEACLKGCGVDCGYLALAVHAAVGTCKMERFPHYSSQWQTNGIDEIYLREIQKRAREVDSPLPGDIAVFQIFKVFGHGAIVTDWPMVIHAGWKGRKVERSDASKRPLSGRAVKFFSPWSPIFGEDSLPPDEDSLPRQ